MNILCTICSDLINQSEDIYVTNCGHIFHYHCLAQWIERSKSCPQCRTKVTSKCMFRIYPTVSNENNTEDAATLQSRLDHANLELRQERAKFILVDQRIATLVAESKRQTEIATKYEKQLVIFESQVNALREQLNCAKLKVKEMHKVQEENDSLKKNMQTLNGLQKVLNATSDEVEQMLQGYSDSRTIATFATALKRALCESESKKSEWRDKLYSAKQQLALEKKSGAELQHRIKQLEAQQQDNAAKIKSLEDELESTSIKKHTDELLIPAHTPQRIQTKVLVHKTPGLNDAILETDSNDCSFGTMVNKIENSESPYLNLQQGGLLCLTALQRAPIKLSETDKPSEHFFRDSIKNATKKRIESQTTTSIFHRKEPMKMESFDTKTSLDISYDGMGGHSKIDTFPVPRKSPIKSCIPKLTAKHRLKRPNTAGNHDIQAMLKKLKEK